MIVFIKCLHITWFEIPATPPKKLNSLVNIMRYFYERNSQSDIISIEAAI